MRFLVDALLPPSGIFATHAGWIIVTKDEDFPARVVRSRPGPQVVWLRIGNSTKRGLLAWFAPPLPDILRELAAGRRIVKARR